MTALLVFGQALVMGGCICLGMFTNATVQCSMPVVQVPLSQQEAAVPCDAEAPTAQRAA